MKLKFQPTISICFALTLFAINSDCPAYAKTDERRKQKLVLKLLSKPDQLQFAEQNDTIANKAEKEDSASVVLRRNNTLVLKSERSREPPLISGKDSQLTLTLMEKFKNSWCKTETFMQLVDEPGCIKRKILNRFCYGQCNSFYIPRTIKRSTKRKVFKSCGFCKPNRTHSIIVTLRCPGRPKGYKYKKIKQVKQCLCMDR